MRHLRVNIQAVLVIIAMAHLVMANTTDCSSVSPLEGNENVYLPPEDCRRGNQYVAVCNNMWYDCMAFSDRTKVCDKATICVQSYFVCIDNIPPGRRVNTSSAAACDAWNASYTAMKAYVETGGAYAGSALQTACQSAVCFLRNASRYKFNSCGLGDICGAAPRPPPKFAVTLSGHYPPEVDNYLNCRPGRDAWVGILDLLCVPPHTIFISDIRYGDGLTVEFVILDPTVDAVAVARTVKGSVGASLRNVGFSRLGNDVYIRNASVGEGSPVNFSSTFTRLFDPIPRFVLTLAGEDCSLARYNDQTLAAGVKQWLSYVAKGVEPCAFEVNITVNPMGKGATDQMVAELAVVQPKANAYWVAEAVESSVGTSAGSMFSCWVQSIGVGHGSSVNFSSTTMRTTDLSAPAGNGSLYLPPEDCRQVNVGVAQCYRLWSRCVQWASRMPSGPRKCHRAASCARSFLVCIDHLPPSHNENVSSSPSSSSAATAGAASCTAWSTSFAELRTKRTYRGSALHGACRSASSLLFQHAAPQCTLTDICVAGPVPAATFVVRLVAKNKKHPRANPFYRIGSVARGIAQLVCVQEHFLFVRHFRSSDGWLDVEFTVLDPDVDAAAVARKVHRSIGADLRFYSGFKEVLTIPVFISEAAVREGSSVNFSSTAAPRRDRIPRFVITFSGQSAEWLKSRSQAHPDPDAIVAVKVRLLELLETPYCSLEVDITVQRHVDYYHLVADVAMLDPTVDAPRVARKVQNSVGTTRLIKSRLDATIVNVAAGEGSSVSLAGEPLDDFPAVPGPPSLSSLSALPLQVHDEDVVLFLFLVALIFSSIKFYRYSTRLRNRNGARPANGATAKALAFLRGVVPPF